MSLILILGVLGSALAAEVKLTSGDGANDYFQPDVSGNKVVWLKGMNQAGGLALISDVYLHTLGGSTVKANSVKKGHAPAVSGTNVAWEDVRNDPNGILGDNTDIYGYTIAGGTQQVVTTETSDQLFPSVDGGRTVWQDFRNGNWDVYMKDTNGVTYRITTNTEDQTEPRIEGNLIVWTDDRNPGGWDDVYVYDLAKDTNSNGTPDYKEADPSTAETRITTHEAKQNGPDVSGRKIVWTDWRGNRRNIYFYDLDNPVANGQAVNANTAVQHSPRISGNLVVWTDWRNTTYPTGGNTDIYAHSLENRKTVRITSNTGAQTSPAISGKNIVWADSRNTFWDVYYYNLTPKTTVNAPVLSTALSKTTKFKVSWQGAGAPSLYDVRYKEGTLGAWKTWLSGTTSASGYFSAKEGRTYYFQARSRDILGNQGAWSAMDSTVVPYDQERLIYRRSGFLGLSADASSANYMGTARTSRKVGDYVVYKVYGNKVSLVVTKGPGRSKGKVFVDGVYRGTVDTKAAALAPRKTVFSTSWAKAGTHYLKVRNLATPGRKRFDIDAVAVKDVPVDTKAPTAKVGAPTFSTDVSKTTKFKVSWAGFDPAPFSGVASYDVRWRPLKSSVWKTWFSGTTREQGFFSGARGSTYVFQARARDFYGNVGPWSTADKTVVPYNEGDKIFKRVGFTGLVQQASSSHYMGTLRFSEAANTYVTYKFFGKSASVLSTKGPARGRAKIYVDGVYVRTVDAKAATVKNRQRVFTKSFARDGVHYIKILNLATPGRPQFDVDGLAVGH